MGRRALVDPSLSELPDVSWRRTPARSDRLTLDTEVISNVERLGRLTREKSINVLSRGPSGRVLSIAFVTGTPTSLPSSLFYVEPIVDRASKEVAGYRVYGGGFGHGVGLSQTGAVGLAQQGHDFREILGHYYQGVDLTRQY